MIYQYLGYTEDNKMVKGTIPAASKETAAQILARYGYQILSLKPVTTFMPNLGQLFPSLKRVRPEMIIWLARQLAILIESGINIVASLELSQRQTSNNTLKTVLREIISDLRSGNRLSAALDKYPKIFPPIFACRLA